MSRQAQELQRPPSRPGVQVEAAHDVLRRRPGGLPFQVVQDGVLLLRHLSSLRFGDGLRRSPDALRAGCAIRPYQLLERHKRRLGRQSTALGDALRRRSAGLPYEPRQDIVLLRRHRSSSGSRARDVRRRGIFLGSSWDLDPLESRRVRRFCRVVRQIRRRVRLGLSQGATGLSQGATPCHQDGRCRRCPWRGARSTTDGRRP